MTDQISFFVPGHAAPGGSKKAFMNPKTNRIVVLDDAKNNKGWRQVVALFGSTAMAGRQPLEGPLFVSFTFYQRRPKGHHGTGKNASIVKASAPAFPTSKPDCTKLIRAAEDALLQICYEDDAQIVHQIGRKVYGPIPGLRIVIKRMQAQDVIGSELVDVA